MDFISGKSNINQLKRTKDVEALIQALNDKDWRVRKNAAYALGEIDDKRNVEPLIKALGDKDWGVRKNSADALGKIGEPAVEKLIKALSDKDWRVRWNAAYALGEIGSIESISALEKATKDYDNDVREKAKEALTKIKSSDWYKKEPQRKQALNTISIAEENLKKAKKLSIFSINMEELLTKARNAFDNKDYENATKYAYQSKDIAESAIQKSKPKLSLTFPSESFRFNTWKRIDLTINNNGNTHAKYLQVELFGDVEFKKIKSISTIKPNETKKIDFAIKPIAEGNVPIDVHFKYKDFLERDYTTTETIIISVGELVSKKTNKNIIIKRGYSLKGEDIKFGIKVINNTDYMASDVEVILDYPKKLVLKEPNSKIQTLGNIPPNSSITAIYLLKPLTCLQGEIGALVVYKDATGKKHTINMKPKEVHNICPFLQEKHISEGEYSRLVDSSEQVQEGISFKGISLEDMAVLIKERCKNMLYIVNEYELPKRKIMFFSGESTVEKLYYLLTLIIQEKEELTQIILIAYSDKKHGLAGFMSEVADSIRNIVSSIQSAKEVGIIEKKQIINIIDSIVHRTSFGEIGASINILDSVVQRSNIGINTCPECGIEVSTTARFCVECGAKLHQ
ncbi:MAG: HEAT repeat domain-containing protein [Methanosarcinales archaeon]